MEKLATMTPGMVGADLANLVNEATLLAVGEKRKRWAWQNSRRPWSES